ncbi:MAG: hypothetical protein ACREM1_17870 [Longimicrobiales bacterium]
MQTESALMFAGRLRRILELLEKTQPLADEHDVVWPGPYYIPSPREWCPSRFMLYCGVLYISLFVRFAWHGLSWRIGSDEVEFEQTFSFAGQRLDDAEWAEALAQIERRLQSALRNFAAYNRRVARLLPPGCRTGRIQRHLTWPKGAKPPLSARDLRRFEQAMKRTERSSGLEGMTLSAYLDTVAVAYDATFEELHPLPPVEKYKRRADGRHGGLLDLPPHDAEAFTEWFHSRRWSGTHSWEIVFGHPHGILIAPRQDANTHQWSYSMAVDSEMWYADAARMGIALAAHSMPFEFHDSKKVSDALQGVDDVDVGPGPYRLSYEELGEERPDALSAIRWDPIPETAPITPH